MIIHFSCGATSAIAAAIALKEDPAAEIVYADTGAEHPDNERFMKDCERVLFKKKVTVLRSSRFAGLKEVIESSTALSLRNGGALCTSELKKIPIRDYVGERLVTEEHVYGYDTGEIPRIERYKENNPEVKLKLPLIDYGLSKANCLALLQRFNIELPMMYRLGYEHSNCIGCVKARDSVGYWEAIRQDFPDVFQYMAKQERRVGSIDPDTGKPKGFALNRRTRKGVRSKVWLDEWPNDIKPKRDLEISCGYSCGNVGDLIEGREVPVKEANEEQLDDLFNDMTKEKTMSIEEKKPKHRARRKKEEKPTPAKGLLDALKFIKPTQKKNGTVEQRHCLITNHWMVATNGILTIATPIAEDLQACPQTAKLEEALKKTGEELSITQLSAESLSVGSGEINALVPCMSMQAVQPTGPDPIGGPIDDSLKDAFKLLAPIVTEGASEAYAAAVLMAGTTAVATNDHVIVEAHHGLNLPTSVLVPKAACMAVAKSNKVLTGLGYSGPSCTFHFEDGSFIKTQLFAEQYPNYGLFLDADLGATAYPAADNLFEAIGMIATMSNDGTVYFREGGIWSEEEGGSNYKIDDMPMPENFGFNSKYLMLVKGCFDDVTFMDGEKRALHFTGPNMRGMVMALGKQEEV